MKIYNTRALTRNERMVKGLIAGIIAAIGCGIVLGCILRVVDITFNIMYLAVGYGVGYAIRTYGKGVQVQFSIMGAILTFISLMIADVIEYVGFVGLLMPQAYVYAVIVLFSINSIWALLNFAFHVGAVILGYEQSRIV